MKGTFIYSIIFQEVITAVDLPCRFDLAQILHRMLFLM